MRTWRQPISDELVPEVLNYSGGGAAATAVTPPVARENIGAGPDVTVGSVYSNRWSSLSN
jgi:hypothetical protein